MSSTLGNANYSNDETKKSMPKKVPGGKFFLNAKITKIISNGEFKTVIVHLINHTEFFIIYLTFRGNMSNCPSKCQKIERMTSDLG